MKRLSIVKVVVLGFFAALAFWLARGIHISYHHPIVTSYTFETDKVSSSVRLAFITDLHDGVFGEENSELVESIAALSPDAILMGGDMLSVDSPDSGIVCTLIEALVPVAPVYYAEGNHEISYMRKSGDWNLYERIETAGATVMDLAYQDLTVRGETIRIGAMYDYAFALDDVNSTNPERMRPSVYRFLTDFQNTDAYKVMISHRPDSFYYGEAAETWNIDLVLSGHVHGGQVVLPFVGGLYAPDQGFFPTYVHGLYPMGRIQLLISSGLGSQKGNVPRINNPPEIVLVTIMPAQQQRIDTDE